LEPGAIRVEREGRNPQIRLDSTPGGSAMITLRQPKRSQAWHRPRLVV
jgi:hypothetical protein